ncbi:MAG: thioesterase family protein [Moraxellaceae bacterium]|nr:MAG: thioesterase family protein [Moraxellaceae bacterium]
MSEQSSSSSSDAHQQDQNASVQPAASAQKSGWTGNISTGGVIKMDVMLQQLCRAFNTSPFFHHLNMEMILDGQDIKCIVEMDTSLIGNVAFQILHGGVAATLLDSIGGIVAMGELYRRADKDHIAETVKKVTRLATVDMRIDYIAPGRGKRFIGSAEVLRMGRKGCTTRMNMHNDEGKLIATGIASYAY